MRPAIGPLQIVSDRKFKKDIRAIERATSIVEERRGVSYYVYYVSSGGECTAVKTLTLVR